MADIIRSFRLKPEDQKLIDELSKKSGIQQWTEVIRWALRCCLEKEGWMETAKQHLRNEEYWRVRALKAEGKTDAEIVDWGH